jgi:hypothetical protein
VGLFIRLVVAALVILMPVSANATWHEARTEHFIIYADQKPEELREFAQRLERFDRAVRTVRRMKDPPLTDSNRLTIFVLSDLYAIGKLAGGYGVAGFYIPSAAGSVAFVPKRAGSKKQKWDLDAEAVFFHEYAHHLQLQQSDLALPTWVTEGFAEFFGPTQLRDDGSVVLGAVPTYRASGLFNYSDLSIEEMVGADSRINGFEYALMYGRGWLLTHYLTFSHSRRGQLDRYAAQIQQGVPPIEAARSAFGDLTQLNKELYGYIRQKTLPHLILSSSQLPTGAINIKPLATGEDEMMGVFIRSKRGATRKTAADIALSARKIAGPYPGSPFVQTALAEAELDAGNLAAAEAAADRALAAEPSRLGALILKGRAQMESARRSPREADWSAIRKWFLKANKIDPEAAEPLLLFYQTYLYAGERPSGNAMNGLLYSLVLAPQDEKLRMTVVRQMLVDGRTQDAQRYFAPFAFEPHYSRNQREASAKTMAALTSGDQPEALTQLGKLEELILSGD